MPPQWEQVDLKDLTADETAVLASIEREKIPKHIACIMDGNGRWAKTRSKERIFGHRIARNAVRQVVDTCHRLGVEYLTLYTFSSENWRRPRAEVTALMQLLKDTLSREKGPLNESNVRLRIFGNVDELPNHVKREAEDSERLMRQNTGLNLNLAINYGGRAEIIQAVRDLADQVASGSLQPDQITEESLSGRLFTGGMPDPELLIRTGGEQRISNFLLWQLAYTELWVTPTLWPDFTRLMLLTAIGDYQERNRRFGGL